MLRLDNISVNGGQGNTVLRHINLRIDKGGFYLLTGSPGSGKTALVELLALVRRPSAGAVTFLGHDISTLAPEQLSPMRRRIGVLFQNTRLLDHLTLYDNIALPLEIAGVNRHRYHYNVLELIRWLGLEGREARRPAILSGSERRNLALARAIVTRPPLLLADDPLAALDETATRRIIGLFTTLNQFGTTILMTTPDRTTARRIPDTVSLRRHHLENGALTDAEEAAGPEYEPHGPS